jgi:hypothetical protein
MFLVGVETESAARLLVPRAVDINDWICDKSTLQWTALAIVFKSGEQHPDMSQHQSKWKWKFQLPVSQT